MSTNASSRINSQQKANGTQSPSELSQSLGGILSHRIRFEPAPGTATENDCLQSTQSNAPCELVNGILVEKAMGTPEGFLGQTIAFFLMMFVRPRRLGLVMGEGGFFRLANGTIRLPDASFTRKERLPNPLPQVSGWCPDLCVEVLSPDNTPEEMERKRKENFASGCQLLWILDRTTKSCQVWTSDTDRTTVTMDGSLDGGSVLPGFTVSMKEIFAEFDDYFPGQ